jgi:outer membrane lipoprotein-sorting protein/peroxiredoxin
VASLGKIVSLFKKDDPLGLKAAQPSVESVSVGAPTQIDGTPVDILDMRLEGGPDSQFRAYIALGQADHLPRRMTLSAGTATVTWTLSDVKVNPQLDKSVFTFTPPPDPVDSKARAVLAAMAKAYANLKSYSSTNYLKVTGQEAIDACTAIKLRRPFFGSITTLSDKKTTHVISNGKELVSFNSSDKDLYDKSTAPEDWYAFAQKAAEIDPQAAFNPDLFKPGDPLGFQAFGHMLESLVVGPPSTVAGVPVDTLEGRFQEQGHTATIRAYVGQDHLLRRLTYDIGSMMSADLVLTDVKANPTLPADLFKAVPPQGAKLRTAAANPAEPPMYDPRLKPGAQPFPITAKDMDGKSVTLAGYRGKVLLLDFWATWCGPCMGEVPNVVKVYRKHHVKGFEILGISLDQADGRSNLLSVMKAQGMTWRQVFDGQGWTGAVPKLYAVQAIPFTVLVGRNGRIAAVNARGDELDPAVTKALAQK